MFDARLSASIEEVKELLKRARSRLEEIAASVPRAPEEESLEDIEGTPDPRTQVRALVLSVSQALPLLLEELDTAQSVSEGRG